MDKAIEDIYELLKEFIPFLTIPVAISVLSYVLKIVKETAQGCYIADMKGEIKRKEKELIKEPEKIDIDKDLQKYFNYKE